MGEGRSKIKRSKDSSTEGEVERWRHTVQTVPSHLKRNLLGSLKPVT